MSDLTYFLASVKVSIEQDNGKIKSHTEQFLVQAVNVTDVEVKMNEEYANFNGEWELTSVRSTKIIKVC